jgi:uncharacterized protein GlcG (DUF336 family)
MTMIGLDDALRVIAAARAEAENNGERIGIVVVDTRGDVKASARCDGALFRAMQLAEGKAFASATHGTPSSELLARADTPVMRALMHLEHGRIIPVPGAVPLRRDGVLLGAVGVSGAPTGQRDEDIALVGAAAFAPDAR